MIKWKRLCVKLLKQTAESPVQIALKLSPFWCWQVRVDYMENLTFVRAPNGPTSMRRPMWNFCWYVNGLSSMSLPVCLPDCLSSLLSAYLYVSYYDQCIYLRAYNCKVWKAKWVKFGHNSRTYNFDLSFSNDIINSIFLGKILQQEKVL